MLKDSHSFRLPLKTLTKGHLESFTVSAIKEEQESPQTKIKMYNFFY
jgi:hypothetical protein